MNKTKAVVLGAIIVIIALAGATPILAVRTTAIKTVTDNTSNLVCIQTAVDVREAAIAEAFNVFSASISSALSARKSALHDAWGIANASARHTVRNKAWSDFRNANKAASSALRVSRREAWSAFGTASKACRTPVVESADQEGVGSLGL